ncbi:hypothetical protein [Actinokineospora sp. NBRC 105648]|uniref:hypothetical protein n=1 Tax=Actinokineospora sp. NBRC 105648 TaxID=3032206 RepID=UPI0024A40A84|nr:hypothetical protein [Actinokineospora sp. NBRC 105648]GLZ41836.1 hypothetical protein Acsp05_54600 [Actinokineospora sp. NBRC 105648]
MRAAVWAVAAVVVLAGCAAPDTAVRFERVDLPAEPITLTTAGDALVIGVRRGETPGILRRAADGTTTEIPAHGTTPYGLLARWTAIAVDGDKVVAVGGERGGAHGNVRWSVWSGTTAGITEQRQAFSTFGGYGAGDLFDAEITTTGPVVLGGWESAKVGFDVATWLPDGDIWNRQSSAGTALESSQAELPFPLAATTTGDGILIAGWELAGSREQAVVWRSTRGVTGWTKQPLPDTGTAAQAMAIRCTGPSCLISGAVDGKLAIWRFADNTWTRLSGVPAIAVNPQEPIAAPLESNGQVLQLITDGDRVKAITGQPGSWQTHDTTGPTGKITTAIQLADTTYAITTPGTLWRVSIKDLSA